MDRESYPCWRSCGYGSTSGQVGEAAHARHCLYALSPQCNFYFSCSFPPLCSGCDIGPAGWRSMLHSLTQASGIKTLKGLRDDFIRSTRFDPASVLRDLQWPVDLLQRDSPERTILQFCRELSHGVHNGDPVASMLLLGPGGAGKSTLLHRLQTDKWKPDVQSTDGLRVGASRHVT